MRVTHELILNAVLMGHISTDALTKIISIHNEITRLGIDPKSFGRVVDDTVTTINDKQRQTAFHFCTSVQRNPAPDDFQVVSAHNTLNNWKAMNPAKFEKSENGGRPYFQNKIVLIKKFREDFGACLADAKAMVEYLYEH